MRGKYTICIKTNNSITNDPCVICGERCDPCGIDFFLDHTCEQVCSRCAEHHAPALYHMQRHWHHCPEALMTTEALRKFPDYQW